MYDTNPLALAPSPLHIRESLRYDADSDDRFRRSGRVWDASRIKSPKNVGRLMEACKRLQPSSPEEWEAAYFSTVLPLSTARTFAAQFRNLCLSNGLNLTPQEALDHFVIRVIDQTFAGFQGEVAGKLVMERVSGGSVRFATHDEDARWHVDLIIESSPFAEEEEQHAPVGVQLKPRSFFRLPAGHYSKRENAAGNALFTREMGGDVIYLCTDDVRAGIFRPMPFESYAPAHMLALAA